MESIILEVGGSWNRGKEKTINVSLSPDNLQNRCKKRDGEEAEEKIFYNKKFL